jgi:hypothetical protein
MRDAYITQKIFIVEATPARPRSFLEALEFQKNNYFCPYMSNWEMLALRKDHQI